MTLSSFFHGLSSNLISGGVGAVLVLAAMFWSANKTAATGSKAKMTTWSMAPAIMVIAAIITHGVAAGIAIPKLQAMFQSAPVQNTMAMGGALSAAADTLLFSNGGDGGMVVGTDAFKAPLVNGGQTASFVEQPAPVQASTEVKIVSNAQAVQAINALGATATPAGQAYINAFLAENTQSASTYTVKGGDSMSAIAGRLGVSVKSLCAANAATVPNCNVISAGMTLVVPATGSGGAPIVNSVPANYGQQTTVYNTQPAPAPVYAHQSNQQAAVAPTRNVNNGQVVITSNADAVAAIHSMAPVPTPTARPAYVLTEILNKPASGGGQAYIDQFLKTQTDTTVASAGN